MKLTGPENPRQTASQVASVCEEHENILNAKAQQVAVADAREFRQLSGQLNRFGGVERFDRRLGEILFPNELQLIDQKPLASKRPGEVGTLVETAIRHFLPEDLVKRVQAVRELYEDVGEKFNTRARQLGIPTEPQNRGRKI
jgi:hypothetical protein